MNRWRKLKNNDPVYYGNRRLKDSEYIDWVKNGDFQISLFKNPYKYGKFNWEIYLYKLDDKNIEKIAGGIAENRENAINIAQKYMKSVKKLDETV